MPEKDPNTSLGKADSIPVAEDSEIEGGFIGEIREPPFDERAHRAQTAQRLVMLFAWIFAGALAVHYVCFMVLSIMGREQSVDALGRIFNVWLPALTGIVSAGATYYFTKET
jgi:hypothetical protein